MSRAFLSHAPSMFIAIFILFFSQFAEFNSWINKQPMRRLANNIVLLYALSKCFMRFNIYLYPRNVENMEFGKSFSSVHAKHLAH